MVEDAQRATDTIRKVVQSDRALHDKAQRGFVSWAKAYSKHQASSIFRLGDLEWADVGNSWGLLKLPKMPELKRWEGEKDLGVRMDWKMYAYRDRQREQARQLALPTAEVQEQVGRKDDAGPVKARKKELKRAWSQKLDQREEREVRRDQKRRKRERENWEKMTDGEREEQKELEGMIEAVKKQKREEDRYGEFHGFDE